jgi:hypothetical protein
MLVERLRTFLVENWPLASRCLDLMALGCHTPREQAARLARPVEEVYDAHECIRRHGKRIREEWEASERERMGRLLRERAVGRRSGS